MFPVRRSADMIAARKWPATSLWPTVFGVAAVGCVDRAALTWLARIFEGSSGPGEGVGVELNWGL
ncbi:hypothetical protein MLPF_2912 [Mycobacterium lepromatosis]|nr:hypothetical protein MLPF_2912 [Mycobacterium lepromatosis]